MLLLLIAAAQAGPNAAEQDEVELLIALGLHACGWGFSDTARPATKYEVYELTRDTRTVLHRLRATDAPFRRRGHERSEAELHSGATLARAALLTWA